MPMKSIVFPGMSLTACEGWEDTTGLVQGNDAPFTVTKAAAGVGALQFSPAIYERGERPEPTLEDLSKMLREFAANHQLGDSFEQTVVTGELFGIGASYHREDDFIRVWYLSNGWSFLLVTYVCEWESRHVEVSEREQMVSSIRLQSSTTERMDRKGG